MVIRKHVFQIRGKGFSLWISKSEKFTEFRQLLSNQKIKLAAYGIML